MARCTQQQEREVKKKSVVDAGVHSPRQPNLRFSFCLKLGTH